MQPNLIFNPTECVSRSAAGLVAAVVPAEISVAHLRTTCPHEEVGTTRKGSSGSKQHNRPSWDYRYVCKILSYELTGQVYSWLDTD